MTKNNAAQIPPMINGPNNPNGVVNPSSVSRSFEISYPDVLMIYPLSRIIIMASDSNPVTPKESNCDPFEALQAGDNPKDVWNEAAIQAICGGLATVLIAYSYLTYIDELGT
jgi:hypothetical protein